MVPFQIAFIDLALMWFLSRDLRPSASEVTKTGMPTQATRRVWRAELCARAQPSRSVAAANGLLSGAKE
jgi:hypothetical protein